jgi:hypothetical protein
MMLAMISGGNFFSLENGPPGASLIRKKLSVTMMNNVGMTLKNLRTMNLDIVASLAKGAGVCGWQNSPVRRSCPSGQSAPRMIHYIPENKNALSNTSYYR